MPRSSRVRRTLARTAAVLALALLVVAGGGATAGPASAPSSNWSRDRPGPSPDGRSPGTARLPPPTGSSGGG